jgi:hypothetical protein
VEVSTNGAALTEKVCEKLLEKIRGRRHDIWVSHHGIDKDTLEYIMRIDYDKATANLIRLLKMADGKYTIKIRGAGESRDQRHVYFTRQQYLDHFTKLFRDNSISPNRNVTIDWFQFHDRAGTLHREDRGANLLNLGTIRQIDPQHSFHCVRIDEWAHFDWQGNIRLCCMDYHHEVKLPNVHEGPLLDYFHSDTYYDLVEKVSGRKACEPGFICTRCSNPGG